MTKYYAQITGNANVTTNFKPYTVWSNNSYLRLEYNGDITTRNGGICPFFAGQSPWFCLVQDDLDRYDKIQYLNIGNSTYIGSGNSWNTDGFQNTTVITFNSSAITMVNGEQSYTGSFSGNIPNNNMGFFANYSNGLQMNFYELKVYGYGDVLLYDFVPDLSGTTKGIRDRVSGTFTAATNQSYISLVSLRTFEIDTTEIDASYSGTSTSVTVTADSGTTWTASTSDSWISITNPTGSGNGSFTVVVSANSKRSAKTGTVTVTSSESDVLTISVSQEKMPFLFNQKPLYRSGESVVKMYRNGELIYLKVNPHTTPPEPPTPTYQWVEVTSGFGRTLAFTKVRWATGATWNDGFFSELPNINCDGQGWSGIQSAEWGYAGWYTQNLKNKKFFEKTGATSYATRNMSSPTCTLTDDALTPVSWEYEYQVPLYWGGMSNTGNYTAFNGGTGLYVYVKVTTE